MKKAIGRRSGQLGWLAALVLWPFLSGFSAGAMFETSADLGGGGGLTYTGSATAHGLTCSACHQGAAPAGSLKLQSAPAGLFDDGFEPGTTYTISVQLSPEQKGLARNGACEAEMGGCNRNGFVAEFLNGNGLPAGQLCVDGGKWTGQGCDSDAGKQTTLFAYARAVSGVSLQQPEVCAPGGPRRASSTCLDVDALLASGKTKAEVDQLLKSAVRGRTTWEFQWLAPQTSGAVAFHLGAVDGDGGTTLSPNHNDYYGDDVYVVAKTLWRKGTAPAAEAGCSVARAGMSRDQAIAAGVLCAALAMLWLRAKLRPAGPRSAGESS